MRSIEGKLDFKMTAPDSGLHKLMGILILVLGWVLILSSLSAADSLHKSGPSAHKHKPVSASQGASPFAVSEGQKHHHQKKSEVCYFHLNNLPCPHHKNKPSDEKEICIKRDCPPGSAGASVNFQSSKNNSSNSDSDFFFAVKEVQWSFLMSSLQYSLMLDLIDPPPRLS